MIRAYLFIHLDQNYNGENILDDVRQITQVREAYRLYGMYDLVVYMETETTEELKAATLESIRKLQFVESTVTFISLNSYFKSN